MSMLCFYHAVNDYSVVCCSTGGAPHLVACLRLERCVVGTLVTASRPGFGLSAADVNLRWQYPVPSHQPSCMYLFGFILSRASSKISTSDVSELCSRAEFAGACLCLCAASMAKTGYRHEASIMPGGILPYDYDYKRRPERQQMHGERWGSRPAGTTQTPSKPGGGLSPVSPVSARCPVSHCRRRRMISAIGLPCSRRVSAKPPVVA